MLDNGVVVIAKETRDDAGRHHQSGDARRLDLRSAGRAGHDVAAVARHRSRHGARDPPSDIAEELDSRGISLTITRHPALFSLVCTCLAEDFEPVLALLGDILMSPSLAG